MNIEDIRKVLDRVIKNHTINDTTDYLVISIDHASFPGAEYIEICINQHGPVSLSLTVQYDDDHFIGHVLDVIHTDTIDSMSTTLEELFEKVRNRTLQDNMND